MPDSLHSLEKVLILAYSTRIVSKWPIFVFYRTYLGAAIFSRTATPACKPTCRGSQLACSFASSPTMDAVLRFPSDCSMAPSRPGVLSAATHSKSVATFNSHAKSQRLQHAASRKARSFCAPEAAGLARRGGSAERAVPQAESQQPPCRHGPMH